jgi:ArsR family transcriptional regulator
MNDLLPSTSERMSQLFQAISAPARLEILLAIGRGEACVCHLEAVLGYRQAYISQHLRALRDARVIAGRREGRYMYYRLQNQELLELINAAGRLCDLRQGELERAFPPAFVSDCACPNCATSAPISLMQVDLPDSIE